MSNFGNFLEDAVKASGQTGREMSARMGIDPSQLSGFITGKRPSCNPETLAKIVSGVSDDHAVQAGLLQAYLRDQTLPEMREWVNVLPPNVLTDEPPKYGRDEIELIVFTLRRLALPKPIPRAILRIIQAMPGHEALQDLIIDLADFAEEVLKSAPEQKPKKPKTKA